MGLPDPVTSYEVERRSGAGTLEFHLGRRGPVLLRVLDVRGRAVRDLTSGLYIARLQTADAVRTARVLVLR